MDKPSNERGSTGPTDGIKAEGDAGNERLHLQSESGYDR